MRSKPILDMYVLHAYTRRHTGSVKMLHFSTSLYHYVSLFGSHTIQINHLVVIDHFDNTVE